MDRQIVFVLSTNYAGSHFLTLQLGSHSRCTSIGELHHLRRKGTGRVKACRRCESDEACPLFSGLPELPISALYRKLFENLQRYDQNVNVVIDNSKKTRWASCFLDLPGYTKKYIHLIRDPRALIRRWTLCYEGVQAKNKVRRTMARRCWKHPWNILQGDEANVYLWKWLYQNRLITDFIRNNHLDARLVTYHDLVFYPDENLSELMSWLGLDYEPQQKQYWSFVHHGSFKPLYMDPRGDGQRLFDQRWKDLLGEETRRTALTHPGITAYVKDAGLIFDPEKGLTRKAAPAGTSPMSLSTEHKGMQP
jgi:hypothetical protein